MFPEPLAVDSNPRQDCGVDVTPLQRDDVVTRHDYYQPVYRVDFWQRHEAPLGIDPEKMMYKQDSYRIDGAKNVREVRA